MSPFDFFQNMFLIKIAVKTLIYVLTLLIFSIIMRATEYLTILNICSSEDYRREMHIVGY